MCILCCAIPTNFWIKYGDFLLLCLNQSCNLFKIESSVFLFKTAYFLLLVFLTPLATIMDGKMVLFIIQYLAVLELLLNCLNSICFTLSCLFLIIHLFMFLKSNQALLIEMTNEIYRYYSGYYMGIVVTICIPSASKQSYKIFSWYVRILVA